jgi:hypothetical protein
MLRCRRSIVLQMTAASARVDHLDRPRTLQARSDKRSQDLWPCAIIAPNGSAEGGRFAECEDPVAITLVKFDIGPTKAEIVNPDRGVKERCGAIGLVDERQDAFGVRYPDRGHTTIRPNPFGHVVCPPRFECVWVAFGGPDGPRLAERFANTGP